MKTIVEKDRIGTVRANYSQMDPKERLEFCRTGYVDEKYILRNPVNYPQEYSVGQTFEQEVETTE